MRSICVKSLLGGVRGTLFFRKGFPAFPLKSSQQFLRLLDDVFGGDT